MVTLSEFKRAFDSEFVNELLGKGKSELEQAEIFEEAKRRATAELAHYKCDDASKRAALIDLIRIRLLERYHLPPEEMDSLRRYANSIVERLKEASPFEPQVPHAIGMNYDDSNLIIQKPSKQINQFKFYE